VAALPLHTQMRSAMRRRIGREIVLRMPVSVISAMATVQELRLLREHLGLDGAPLIAVQFVAGLLVFGAVNAAIGWLVSRRQQGA
jgi:hypothetical protein